MNVRTGKPNNNSFKMRIPNYSPSLRFSLLLDNNNKKNVAYFFELLQNDILMFSV